MDKWLWIALAIYLFFGAMNGWAGFYSEWDEKPPRERAALAILITLFWGIILVLIPICLIGGYIIELGYALIAGEEL